MDSFKTTNGLMKHLRNSGILINGTKEKRQLINTGYYHGYKGYRFFNNSSTPLPIKSYSEIYATIQYDSKLKSLLYGKMMFIETALKNIALETILKEIKSSSIYDLYNIAVSSYKNSEPGISVEKKRKNQQNKLNLQTTIQSSISSAYKKGIPKITHFYNNINYNEVPIWAVFEILTLGDFGYLISCLTYDVRDKISKAVGLNLSADTKRGLIYKYIYALKDLRNAIAHNDVVYDARFRKFDASAAMKQCLKLEIHLPSVNFKTIDDYIILMCYFLKIIKVSKTEIKAFIREYEQLTDEYKRAINADIVSITIPSDQQQKMNILKSYI
ncbi:MAG: Abi family protein [Ruminococcus sp.]|nr:Abi family protein [Ruminococcus sp.]